jgi:DNA helicase-2/ATP-dependent DNA helicase PcrA
MDAGRILEGLNPEQRRAVEAVRGPVCILAGAGSGKTTTITHRIAYQVATNAFRPSELFAVTFTDKAAGAMRSRLEALGVRGVRASTFHSAALGQLRRYGEAPGRILASKALLLRQIGNGLPAPYRFRPAADLATEVEWAKNRRLTPDTYVGGLDLHEPPIPVDLAARVFREYERRKAAAGALDFEDLLELAVRQLDDDAHVLADVRERYLAFTVDEYQDVNLLQQSLLDRWLGPRDDLCVVGDDYQSIYGFTGASPLHLLGVPRRFADATVVRLERNYRSTAQVLDLANRLVPRLGGAEKALSATRPEGPPPELRRFESPADEAGFVVARVRELGAQGVPLEEMAVLTRTNARSADFEEAFHEGGIAFQGSSLLERDAARQLLKRLGPADSAAVGAEVRRVAVEQGWLEDPPDRLGERELVRQQDLGRLVRLAADLDDGSRTLADFVQELRERYGPGVGTGVHLLTLHRAKGLEFDAVFLPRLEEKELPIRLARTPDAVAEERRLLYVGLTRARRWLAVTWSGRPSRFLDELGVERSHVAARPAAAPPESPAFSALRDWRLQRSKSDDVPAYVVFHNTTLAEIAERGPSSLAELAAVPGVGPTKLERYGEEVLAVLAAGAEAPLRGG